jgi:hypothetical protein
MGTGTEWRDCERYRLFANYHWRHESPPSYWLRHCISLSRNNDRSQELKLPPGTVCWPLHFSGISLGLTTDSEVQRLLGKGVARKAEGDTGGRYFIDEEHTATLHVVSYTDYVVGEVTLRAGVDPAVPTNELKQAESKWFKPADGFGNWHALRLGSSRDDVAKPAAVEVQVPGFGHARVGHNVSRSWPAGNTGQCGVATVAFLAMLAYCFLQLAGPRKSL